MRIPLAPAATVSLGLAIAAGIAPFGRAFASTGRLETRIVTGLAALGIAALTALTAAPAHAISLGEMAAAAAADLDQLPLLISIAFYVMGVLIAGFGLLRLKRHVDHPSQTTLASGLIALIIGGALIAAPSVINAVGETFAVDNATITRPVLDP